MLLLVILSTVRWSRFVIVAIVFHYDNAWFLDLSAVVLERDTVSDLGVLFPIPDPFLLLCDERLIYAFEQVFTDAKAEEDGNHNQSGQHHKAHDKTLRQIVSALVRCLFFSSFESSVELLLFFGLFLCKFDACTVQFGQLHTFDACVARIPRQTDQSLVGRKTHDSFFGTFSWRAKHFVLLLDMELEGFHADFSFVNFDLVHIIVPELELFANAVDLFWIECRPHGFHWNQLACFVIFEVKLDGN